MPNRVAARTRVRGVPGLLLLGVVAGAAWLRVYRLAGSSLWSDEGNTWALIQRDWATIARDAAADIHPPGYYWLLKAWSLVVGSDAMGMRSLSALLGVLLVLLVFAIGRKVLPGREGLMLGLTAAWVAALNPFQVYYSQEARMYMLLALCAAGVLWALLAWMEADTRAAAPARRVWVAAAFVAWGALGLWTHYSFPVVLAAAGLAYLWHWRGLLRVQNDRPAATTHELGRIRPHPSLLGEGVDVTAALTRYVLANGAVLAAFGPWLPTAIERVLNWPKGGALIAPLDGAQLTLATLTFGPLRNAPEPAWPWLVGGGALVLLGALRLARRPAGVAVILWLAAPIGLMAGLGLYSDAFMKFLLVASPAWALLAAAGLLWPRLRGGVGVTAAAALALAWIVLPGYYASTTARDNYAGAAAYIAATGDAARDVVLLNAPGQGDVWGYYDPGLPVLALPQQRPPDAAATLATLQTALADRRHVYALFWATDESDPDRIVETYLDQVAFRGLESWQGNLRFVIYTLPNRLVCRDLDPAPQFGDVIRLAAHCDAGEDAPVPSGEMGLVGLRWQADAPLDARYKVTVQLLDDRNQVIAQHDAEPAGGSQPTDGWQPGAMVADNHGLAIPAGTPPGEYRLIVALYDAATGARLPTRDGDALQLGAVAVSRPARTLPLSVVPMQQRVDAALGRLLLAGYDLYRKDHSHAPETPVSAGDLVHFTFYWRAPDPLPAGWPPDATFTLRLGEQVLTAPLAGGSYPSAAWQAGELVRGEFDLPYDGGDRRPRLEIEGETLRLAPLPR